MLSSNIGLKQRKVSWGYYLPTKMVICVHAHGIDLSGSFNIRMLFFNIGIPAIKIRRNDNRLMFVMKTSTGKDCLCMECVVNSSTVKIIPWGIYTWWLCLVLFRLCQKQASKAGTSNYISEFLWDVNIYIAALHTCFCWSTPDLSIEFCELFTRIIHYFVTVTETISWFTP